MPTLNWLNRNEALTLSTKAPYRLLEHIPDLSYGDENTENMFIQGDNLDALKALLPYYAGKVKCIYIDPPYNTQSAFEHYDDNLEHSTWLTMMYPRLELLRDLLAEKGSIWVSIDDNEGHYLKAIMDEVFGRRNFITTVIWRKNYAPKSSAKYLSEDHDYILIYAKSKESWRPNLLPRSEEQDKAYKNPDNDPRGLWRPNNLAARNPYSKGIYSITCPSGRFIEGPPPGSYWRVSEEKFEQLDADGRIWWGKAGNNVPAPKIFLSEVKPGRVPQTYWSYEDVGHTQEAKKESIILFGHDVFGTPKPERLIQRILTIASNESDLVLDSFLGSGTTVVVAHKMGRHYIGIEIGEHATTHCIPRLRKVVDGEKGGISEAVSWQGGGGFRFYRLGESVFDEYGHINENIRYPILAAHIWFTETNIPFTDLGSFPLLGVHDGIAYYLLFNGVLGDKSPNGGNVLTSRILRVLLPFDGPKVIYGETTRFAADRLKREGITFKQIPYEIKAR